MPTPSPPPAAGRSKPLLPTNQPQHHQQHVDPFSAASSLYTDAMPPANPESVAYFKPIVQSLLSTDHIFTDALLLKAMLLDPLQQRCIPMSVLAHHPVLVNNGTMPIVPWDILHIIRNTPGWTISTDMSLIRPDAVPQFDHRTQLEQSVYIQMPKSIHLQDLHNLLQVINTVPGVQALQAYPASLLLSVSNQLPFIDRRQDSLTLDTKAKDAFVALKDAAMVKTLMQAIDQAKVHKKGKQQSDQSQQLPSNLVGVLPHMNILTKAEHLLTLVNNARNEQRKQNKPKPAARRQKASGDDANVKIDNWRSASPTPMEEDKQADASDDAGQQVLRLLMVDQSTLIAAAALSRPPEESKQSSVVAPPSQAAIARKKFYTLTKDNKQTTSNFAIGSDDDKGFAADSRLRSKLLLRAIARPEQHDDINSGTQQDAAPATT